MKPRGLFGDPEPRPARSAPVGPAPVEETLAAIAAALPGTLRLGTSSWSFPGWAGIVYDRPATESVLSRTGLTAYARHPLLRATGIDRSYYAPVAAATLAGYAAQVPDDFRFVVKAASQVTDPVVRGDRGVPERANDRFLDVSFASDHVVAPYVEGLGAKGGSLLFQFPPLGRELAAEPEAFAARLARFLEALPRGPAYAVELRDRALYGPSYALALAEGGAVHAVSVHPRVPSIEAQRAWVASAPAGAPLVVRWMLHSGLKYEQAREKYAPFDRLVDEDPAGRSAIAALVVDEIGRGRPVKVIVNNKAEGSAPLTTFRLAGAIRDRFIP